MTCVPRSLQRSVTAAILTAVIAACAAHDDVPSGLGASQLSATADTVAGSGDLRELQDRRAAWIARGIDDYRVQMQIGCFCGGDIRRPVLLEVRNGAVARAWDLETSRPVANLSAYPTITTLFDRAIEQRSSGGDVSVAYDAGVGFPARIEIGTLANDAGTAYHLAAFVAR